MRRGAFGVVVCLCSAVMILSALILCAAAAAQAPSYPRILFPGKDWAMEFQEQGFVVQTDQMLGDGRQYLQVENLTDEVWLWIYMQKVKEGDTLNCGRELDQRIRETATNGKAEDVSARAINSIPVREYMVHTFAGKRVEQKVLIACMAKEDIYVDVHISKLEFRPEDEHFLVDALNSLQIVKTEKKGFTISGATASDSGLARDPMSAGAADGTGQVSGVSEAQGVAAQDANGKTSAYYFAMGTRYYVDQDFKGAIYAYQKGFDLEKEHPALNKTFWRVLVDNLGTVYGLTGELDRAEEVLRYGIIKDPEYPTFYYNVACVYALRGDMKTTMDYLQKAWTLKANLLPGERMPDPTKDESLAIFMGDAGFRKLASTLAAQRD